MVNRHRGEIEAMLDGRSYRLCLTLGALAELEYAFGEDDGGVAGSPARAPFPWVEAMATGLGILRLAPQVFWSMRPRDLDAALKGVFGTAHGANAGRPSEVKVHAKSSGVVSITLWQRPAEDIVEGDTFGIVAGCDKQFSTCSAKFANTRNFRGFPHVPGNDFMLSAASRTDRNDGEKPNR
jgi:uncharacterized phage protein (TIGR02216 family)